MKTEIKVAKQIKTIESVTRERFDDQTRSLLEVALTQLESSSSFSDENVPDRDRKSTRLNSSHMPKSRMPSSA